jgi:RimJ/RimL family protein N-acetyltransferase
VTLTDATIRTARLDLVPFTAAALESLIADDVPAASELLGVEFPADLGRRSRGLLALRLSDLRRQPDSAPWLLRTICLREPASSRRIMVGLTGFHGPPDLGGVVELGYEIEPDHRRNGYAAEAAAALAAWALTQAGVRRVVAAIRPDNAASIGVARRIGFRPAGSRWDVLDGTALLFERRVAAR